MQYISREAELLAQIELVLDAFDFAGARAYMERENWTYGLSGVGLGASVPSVVDLRRDADRILRSVIASPPIVLSGCFVATLFGDLSLYFAPISSSVTPSFERVEWNALGFSGGRPYGHEPPSAETLKRALELFAAHVQEHK